jgi:serine/threonine-protein kinase
MIDQTLLDALLIRYEEARERGAWVTPEQLCPDQPELRDELRRQIDVLESMHAMLSADADPSRSSSELPAADAGADTADEALSTGMRYRILRMHARGGLGEVHLARDEMLGRDVALKRLQPPYARNARSRDRFLREARITGRLEHPSIVPIHGVGVDAVGRPFYAMRFVQGETLREAIDRFHAADRAGEPLGQRRVAFRQLLQRFVAVCNTVAYAHDRAVLHRDIKPENILLGTYGETLLVDWGLAREMQAAGPADGMPDAALAHVGNRAGVFTEAGAVIGTPAYMSPEQAAGEGVGRASDIFSLGATFYTLLVGRPPFEGRNVAEVVARARQAGFEPPRHRRRAVPRALDAVCRKAMAPLAEQRYATALEFAADLEHWLADEPVGAWREPWAARAGRWLRRHRALAAGVVALLAVAATLLSVSTVLIRRQRDRADRNFVLARKAVEDYLTHVTDDPDLKRDDFNHLRKKLLATALPFWEEFVRQDADSPRLKSDRGHGYYRLARLRAEMGEEEEAIADYGRMSDVFGELLRSDPTNADYCQELVKSLNNQAILMQAVGRLDEAESTFLICRTKLDELVRYHPSAVEYRKNLGYIHTNLAMLFEARGRLDEAEESYGWAGDVARQLASDEPANSQLQDDLAQTHNTLGSLFRVTGRLALAEESYREALQVQTRLSEANVDEPSFSYGLAVTCSNLGILYNAMRRPREAESSFRQALELCQRLNDRYPTVPVYRVGLARAWHGLAAVFVDESRLSEAEAYCDLAIAAQERLVAESPSLPQYRQELAVSRLVRGIQEVKQGRLGDAERTFGDAVKALEELTREHRAVPDYQHDLGEAYHSLGDVERLKGDFEAALGLSTRSIDLLNEVLRHVPRNARAKENLCRGHGLRAAALSDMGRDADALPEWERALELDTGQRQNEWRVRRGATLARLGRHAEAAAEVRAATAPDGTDAAVLYDAARVMARAVRAVRADGQLTDIQRDALASAYGGVAIDFLRRSQSAGYFKRPQARDAVKDDVFAPLRSRGDFQRLAAELEERPEVPEEPEDA